MTGRIRWQDTPVGTFHGQVGSLEGEAFAIWKPPQASGEWALTSDLPGQENDRRYGGDPDKLKAEAESWLERFVTSLGAVFKDDIWPPLDEPAGDHAEGEAGPDVSGRR